MSTTRRERRIVCAWFPLWPLENWRRAQTMGRRQAERSSPSPRLCAPEDGEGGGPFLLLARTSRGDVIHDADARGRAVGIVPGQRATDVSAAHPDMCFAYADLDAERRALERLAGWARRWSPSTRVDGVDGIALDATGCAHLWGGEETMLDAMQRRFGAMGLTAQLAAAPNFGAAHALARHAASPGRPVRVASVGLRAALAPLPVSALRLDDGSVTVLRRLGLKTVGLLADMPRSSLKRRFGARRKQRDPRDDTYDDYLGRVLDRSDDVLARLDEALGRVVVPLDPKRPVPPAFVLQGFPEPLMEVRAVLACARPMVERLMRRLAARDEAARAVRLEAFHVDGGRASAVLRLVRPTRDADHVMTLITDKVEGWRAEFGFDALAVHAFGVTRRAPDQAAMGEEDCAARDEAVIDRLAARLGERSVTRPRFRGSYVPERAEEWASVVGGPSGAAPCVGLATPTPSLRPDRLLDPPEEARVLHALPDGPPVLFTWRHVPRRVSRAAGPERIAPEWWRERGHARARDYYLVETLDGARLWLFREGFDGDERGGHPRWYVQGLFG